MLSNLTSRRGDILICRMRSKAAHLVLALMCLLGQALMVGIPPGSSWCLGCEEAAPARMAVPDAPACCCRAPHEFLDRVQAAGSGPCQAAQHSRGGNSSRCCLQLSSHSDPQRFEPRQSVKAQIRLLIVSLPIIFFDQAALMPADSSGSGWVARRPHCEQAGIATTRLLI